MSSEKKSPKIDCKLDSNNYNLWNFQMKSLLVDQSCVLTDAEPVPGCHPLRLDDANPRSSLCIIQNCSQEINVNLMQYTTANEMWDFLYQTYSGQNSARKLTGIKKLATLKYAPGSLEENLNRMQIILADTITAAGSQSIDLSELAITMFLDCLPTRFSSVRTFIETQDKPMKLPEIRVQLIADSQRQKARENHSDFAGMATETSVLKCSHGRRKDRCWTCDPSKHPSQAICKDCKIKGHFSSNSAKCSKKANTAMAAQRIGNDEDWELPKPEFKRTKFAFMVKPGQAQNIVNAAREQRSREFSDGIRVSKKARLDVAGNYEQRSNDRYVLDSGCSQTILMNKDALLNYSPYYCSMSTANDGKLNCIGKGDLVVNSELTIKDVLYCPQVLMNLISTTQICDQGFTLRMDQQYCYVLKGKRIVLRARRDTGLFEITIARNIALLTKGSSRTELFHRRMGHLNLKSLRLLSHLSDGIILDHDPSKACEICAQAKAHKTHFPLSHSLAKRVGDLVHADLCHIGIESNNGKHTMFLLLTDDATRYISIFLLQYKADANDAIIEYDKRIFNKTGRHIATLRSDGGGEFFNEILKDYCKENGIHQESSTPYTPEQNGRAERANRTVLEGTSAMLLDCQLPWCFWGYAAQYFVYLKNRSPHSALYRSTPYQEWFQRLPDLTHVRVFGYPCYAFIPKEVRKRQGPGNKLLPKAVKTIFIGFSERHKAYKCYEMKTKTVIYSASVQFDNEFDPSNGPHEPIPSLLDSLPAFQPEDQELNQQNSGVNDKELNQQTSGVNGNEIDGSLQFNPEEQELNKEQEADATATINEFADANTNAIANAKELESAEAEYTSDSEDDIISYRAAYLIANDSPKYDDAVNGPDRAKWLEACRLEYDSLEKNGVLSEPCVLPNGFTALDTKMVLKLKEADAPNKPRRYKARLCGRGFRQTHGIDYFNTYAPVATYVSLRIFVGLMATMDYEMDTIDVTTAFLHSPIKEEIYIKIPHGYPVKTGQEKMVLKLRKCLYGLKQAPMEWNTELDTFLKSIAFEPLKNDPCIYVRRNLDDPEYILVYVDDMIIAAKSRKALTEIKTSINKRFPSSDKGPIQSFLNVNFTRNRGARTISISQPIKIANLLKDAQISENDRKIISHPCKIPANPDSKLTKEMSPVSEDDKKEMEKIPYKSILGQLLYIAITTRPDISTAVGCVGRYAQNPGMQHWQAVLQILRYLQGTQTLQLILGGLHSDIILNAFSDADWAGDLDGRRSRTGLVVMINNWPIVWSAKLQVSVALSSTEAEYVALSATAKEVVTCRHLLAELGFLQEKATIIYEDNASCVAIAEGQKRHPGVKHIEIRYHFIKDCVKHGDVTLKRKTTEDMVADIFTKNLPTLLFNRHRKSLRLNTDSLPE